MGCVTGQQTKDKKSRTIANSKFQALELELLEMLFNNLAKRCMNDLVTRDTFDVFFHSSGLMGEIIFNRFDYKKQGTIDLQQFIEAFQIMTKGSKQQKSDVLFQIYDISRSGGIKYNQLLKILFSYPLENLNQMLIDDDFLNFIGQNQWRYYFGAKINKIEQRNIVEEDSSVDNSPIKAGFSSSILIKISHSNDKQQNSNEKHKRIQQVKNPPLKLLKPKLKKVKTHIESTTLKIQTFKNVKTNVKVSSNISSLTKKYANFIFKSYNLNKQTDELTKDNFYKLLEDHPALFNIYLSGFHTYIWQLYNAQPQYLSITPYIEGEARQLYQQNNQKVYLKLIRTTIFVFSHSKSKIPLNIVTLEGLAVVRKESESHFGFLIKHRDGIFPAKEYYFKERQIQQEWLSQLEEFKENSFHDNFIILERIGGGNFSNVYKGKQKANHKEVAIKMIQHFKLTADQKEIIKRECSILRQCHHPNIIKYHGQYKTKNELYIITELMHEGDLFEYTKKNGFLEQFQAATIFRQLVDAILYVNHNLGVIHRDLKPENVMIIMSEDRKRVNKIKLIDFGFGIFRDKLHQLPLRDKYAGTPGFIAPELYLRQDYDQKIDTFSLGIILYFMLSGSLPFQSNFNHEIEDLTKNCSYSIVNVHWSNISDNAKDLIAKTLTFKDKRMSTKEIAEHAWLKESQILKERIGINQRNNSRTF